MFKFFNTNSLFRSPAQLLRYMNHIKYTEFIYLMSPLEVYINSCGSCHDQTLFEYTELQSQGLSPKAKFIMTVDEYGKGAETHSFIHYQIEDNWYWFENAWEEFRGIWKFSTEEALIKYVVHNFKTHNNPFKLYIGEFNPKEHTYGESLDTLVDICMNSAEEYNL